MTKDDVQTVCNSVAQHLNQLLSPKNCINCIHFTERIEQCEKYGQRPPARVIAHACPAWKEVVPF